MSPQLSTAHALISRLQDHQIFFLSQGTSDTGQDALYVYAQADGSGKQEDLVVAEITISMLDGSVNVKAKSPAPYMSGLFLQASKFLLSANI
jgi:hypothetical protein